MAEPILTLKNLSKFYTGGQSVVVGLNGISLSFCLGEFVAVTGESGSGKSTLAHVLGGIVPYESGELLIHGNPTSHYDGRDWENYRRNNISFISQSYGILPGSTVMDNVVSALRVVGMEPSRAKEQAQAILRKVELWELRNRRAARLSSGQKQRLSIARALAKPAPILLADEPTGNLDAENSAKVIALLAEAAKDRLVILITHEFSEAESVATRHICLQDGRVTADKPLRAPVPVPEARRPAPLANAKGLGRYVAGVQLRSRPVWCAMMLAFFSLTAFAVFAFLGSFLTALDDTSTRVYDNSAFRNGDPKRIVVVCEDGRVMDETDAQALLSAAYVRSVERYGYVRDMNYAYREGVDYTYRYSLDNTGSNVDPNYQQVQQVSIADNAPFVQTVPLLPPGEKFLTSGRLPETMYEVVAAGDPEQIGSTMSVYIQDKKNWNVLSYLHLEVTVVGVTEWGSGLFFHRDLGRVLTSTVAGTNYALFAPVYDQNFQDKFRCSQDFYQQLASAAGIGNPMVMDFYTQFDENRNPIADSIEELECVGWHSSTYRSYFEVSPELFEHRTRDDLASQMAVTIQDYAYTDRVIAQLEDLGYKALSPYQQCSTKQDPKLAEQRLQTLRISLGVLAVVLVLQVTVLRAMFGMEMDSYRLLSDVGLNCSAAKASIFWQMLAFTVGGQLLGAGGILLCGGLGVRRIVAVLRYITTPHWALLSAVHLAACVLTALWMMRSLRFQVYPFAASDYDLELGQEVEA